MLAAGSVLDERPTRVTRMPRARRAAGRTRWPTAAIPGRSRMARPSRGGLPTRRRPPGKAARRPGARMQGLLDTVRSGKAGDRNGPLYWASRRAAEMIAAGEVDREPPRSPSSPCRSRRACAAGSARRGGRSPRRCGEAACEPGARAWPRPGAALRPPGGPSRTSRRPAGRRPSGPCGRRSAPGRFPAPTSAAAGWWRLRRSPARPARPRATRTRRCRSRPARSALRSWPRCSPSTPTPTGCAAGRPRTAAPRPTRRRSPRRRSTLAAALASEGVAAAAAPVRHRRRPGPAARRQPAAAARL